MKVAKAVLGLTLALLVSASLHANEDGRGNRHALIIGVGNYSDARISPLRGVVHDMTNARQMAELMGVPAGNIRVLQDQGATYTKIRAALRDLAARTRDGDRIFLYYSGHGARFAPSDGSNVCREALVPSDAGSSSKGALLTQEDIAADLAPAYAKADKVFVFIDACHSGGVQLSKRAAIGSSEDGLWSPKFTALDAPESCRVASNVRTRTINDAAKSRGAPGRNVVQLSSSRPDEVSLDSPQLGGLATSSWRYCSTYAEDVDGSGSLSVAEIAACVQRKIDDRLASSTRYSGQHVVVVGNGDFAPALAKPTATAPLAPVTVANSAPTSGQTRPSGTLAGLNTSAPRFPLESVVAQSDERHVLTIRHPQAPLQIGRDFFDLSVNSSRGGYLYMILQSSDNASTYVIFPNSLDQENRIPAGQWIRVPRPSWRLQSRGPAGKNRLLVMVSDAPRDLSALPAQPDGPFMKALSGLATAQSLAWVVGSARGSGSSQCAASLASKDLIAVDECSDSFGAAIVEFVER